MKPHLPLPLLLILTSSALGLTATVVDEDFWTKAAQAFSEPLTLLIENDISTGGASHLVVNSDLTVTAATSATAPSLHVDTSRGGVIVSNGKSASFTGLKDVSFGGTTTGSKKAGTTASQSSSYWPTTGGVFIGEKAHMSISGNSGSVSSGGNSYSSSTSSTSYGAGGAAYFVAQNGRLDLNQNAGGINISNNSVKLTASGTDAFGAGIYAFNDAVVNICGNASVTLTDNSLSTTRRSASGAAIYGRQKAVVTISDNIGTVDISRNTTTTTYSNQTTYGGAICTAAQSTLTIGNNSNVTFSGNKAIANGSGANAWGGAINADGVLSITGNGSVLFENNLAQGSNNQAQGGAIHSGGSSSVSISHNSSVTFLGNTAICADATQTDKNRMGGAVYSGADFSLTGNGHVLFSSNAIRSGATDVNYWNAVGGALYVAKNLIIRDNGSVIFERNFEQRGDSVILRGLYQNGSDAQMELSAQAGSSIIFREAMASKLSTYDTKDMKARVAFNGSYDLGTHAFSRTGNGDIIFSGSTTEDDLNKIKSSLGLGEATKDEIDASRYSTISAQAALLGGRLSVEDSAFLHFSKDLTIYEGATLALSRGGKIDLSKDAYMGSSQALLLQSGSTLSLADGGSLAANNVTLESGTTLTLTGAGSSITTGNFDISKDTIVALTLNSAQLAAAALTLNGIATDFPQLSGITLELDGLADAASGSYGLFTINGTKAITEYDTTGITLRGEGVNASAFRWDASAQTLFYDYVAPNRDIIVDSSTEDLVLEIPTSGNLIVRDNQTATLNSALQAGGSAAGNIIIEHGTASIGKNGTLSGKVIFTEETADTARTLVLATDTTLAAVELQAAAGNTINVEADTATVLSLSGGGSLDKAGNGTLVLSGSESRVQGELAVQSGRVQLQDGASVSGDSIILGSRGRAAVTAEIVTDTLSITPVNGIGSILNHADISSDSTTLGGSAETPAQFDNILLRLTQETTYTLNEAVLSGSRVELTESGATLQAANLVMDSTSTLLAAEGASITLSGDNTLVVGAANMGTTQRQGLTFNLLQSEQLDGVTLATSGSLKLDLAALTAAPSPYVALFFKGLSCEAAEESLSLRSGYRLMEATHADNGLTLYIAQAPEPTVPALLLCALGGIFRRRRA